MPTAPEQTKLKERGRRLLSDLAKQSSGTIALTNQQLRESGAGSWQDYAKQGGTVVTP